VVSRAENSWRLEEMGPAIVVDLTVNEYVEIIYELCRNPPNKFSYPYETYQKLFHELAHYYQVVSSSSGFFQHFLLQRKLIMPNIKYPKNMHNKPFLNKIKRPGYLWANDISVEEHSEFIREVMKNSFNRQKVKYLPLNQSPEEMSFSTINSLLECDDVLYTMKYHKMANLFENCSEYWFWLAHGKTREELYEKGLSWVRKVYYKAQKVMINRKEFIKNEYDKDILDVWSIMEAFSTEITLDTMQDLFLIEKKNGTLNEKESKEIIQELKDERKANEAFFPNRIADIEDFPDGSIRDIQLALCEVSLKRYAIKKIAEGKTNDIEKGISQLRYKILLKYLNENRHDLIAIYKKGGRFEAFCDEFTQFIDKIGYKESMIMSIKDHSEFIQKHIREFHHFKYIELFIETNRVKCMTENQNMLSGNILDLIWVLLKERVDIIAICKNGCHSTEHGVNPSDLDLLKCRLSIVHEKIIDDFCTRIDFERSRKILNRIFPNDGTLFSEVIKDSPIYPLIINSEPALNDDFSISNQ
jgi:hypothetical protein